MVGASIRKKPPHCDVERLSGTLFCGLGHKTKTPISGVFYGCLMGKHRVDGAAVSVVEVIEVVAVSVVHAVTWLGTSIPRELNAEEMASYRESTAAESDVLF